MSIEIARTKKGGAQGNQVAIRPSSPLAASGPSGSGQVAVAQSIAVGVPDGSTDCYIPENGEMGLLEMLHNTRLHDERIAVCSRPVAELCLNYCDFEDNRVSLNDPVMLKGKMGAMQEQLTGVHDGAVISGKQFKGIAGGLNSFMESEYVLVSYKDFSTWALRHFSSEVSGSWMNLFGGKKHVKKYFAIEVGSAPGTFIEITKSQFYAGVNKLHKARVDSNTRNPGSRFGGLSPEQFNAIAALREPEDRHGRAGQGHGHGYGHTPGGHEGPPKTGISFVDTLISYTPLGWYRRVRDETYRAIGSAFVSALLASVAAYVFYRYLIRPFIGGSQQRVPYRSRPRYQQQSRDSQWEGPGLGIMGYGMKDVFTRILHGA